MTLSDVAIRRPVLTIVVTAALMVLGGVSLTRLGTDLFPDVTFPFMSITTIYPGASPSEVERQVSRPLEDAVAGINDLDSVRSFSRESVSIVLVMFKMRANIDRAANDVRERVATVRSQLPQGVHEPSVRRLDINAAPVLTYVASGDLPQEKLRQITEEFVKPQLERAPGVAAVEVKGGRDREILVEIDRKRLDATNLPLTAVIDKLRAENLSLPAGHYQEGPTEMSVRLTGELRTAEEVAKVAIGATQSGSQITLGDIAEVKDTFAESRTRVRSNGAEAVSFEVVKQSGANTIEVADGVTARMAELTPRLPRGYHATLIGDQSTFIRETAHEVEIAIIYGGVMAILVILLFMLDMRSTVISALALPTSVIATFFAMDLFGFTLNMMTLLALSLAIGLLIDDAVVVRENIFRHLERGEDPVEAASKGTSEIALAVMATTLTIVAVFVPVAFMTGIVGQFFRQFGLTVSAAVLISLFVAFTLDPMLSARLAVKVEHGRKRAWYVRFFEGMHAASEEAYAATLRLALRHKVVTVLLGVATFAAALGLTTLMGSEFVPVQDRGQFLVNLEMPPGTSLDETARATAGAEKQLLANKLFQTVYATLGPNGDVNKVLWRVIAVPKTERRENLEDLKNLARQAALTVPGAKVSVIPPPVLEGLPSQPPLMVQVRGSDMARLEHDAAAIEKMLRTIPGLGDINAEYAPGKPEQTVTVDRARAADLGIPVAMVARTLRAALEGEEAGQLRVPEGTSKEVKIRVRLRDADRTGMANLSTVSVATPKGFVPLSSLVRTQPQSGPQVIDRQDRIRQITISASNTTRTLGEVVADLQPKLDAYPFEGDSYVRLDGMVKQMDESGSAMAMALALAVVFIFLILAAQFESFLHPFTIMLSLPLAFVGAFAALFLTDNAISIGANIGIILLMGLVTKNGILLVDAALHEQRAGATPADAIVAAGRRRLRPILMTSAAMILGMLPTAINQGPGSEFRAPMALAVIGGVITSTLLTLIVLPAVYLWFDSAQGGLMRIFRKSSVKSAVPVDVAKTSATVLALLLATGLAVAWPTHATAQPAATPAVAPVSGALTLEEATRRALAHNADLAVAKARLGEAEAARSRVSTAWLPDAKAIGTFTHNSTEAVLDFSTLLTKMGLPAALAPAPTVIQKQDTVSAVFNVDQTLFALSPILMARASDAGIEAQKAALAAAQREIRFRVAEIFQQSQALDRMVNAAGRALALSDERIRIAQLRRKEGTESELPLLRAQAERARAEQDLVRARLARRQLVEILGILMGGPAPDDLAPVAAVARPQGGVHEWTAQARKNRPDLAARRQALLAAEALLAEAEWRWMPILTANGLLRYSDTAGFTGENWVWSTSANLVIPLFDRGSRYAEARERRQTLVRLEAELQKAENELAAQVRQAALEVESAGETLRVVQSQAEVARRSAVIVQKSLDAGAVTPLEVAEADTQLRLAELQEERETLNLQLAVLKLNNLVQP
jgi:hydrophobe/amphiphile efflux-1 (HAE1) family protein